MKRTPIEFTDYKQFKLEPILGKVKGLSERIIAQDDKQRTKIRVLEFEPGTDTTPNGVQAHDYYEEIFILEGSIVDLTLDQEFKAGTVASRPPKMPHGPWKTENGCVMFEVSYYLD